MISYQDARRNMTPAEKIFAQDKLADWIRMENERRIEEGRKKGAEVTNGKTLGVHLDAEITKKERNRSTNTREQIAKAANVSSGTVARYDTVMKSDDEELKKAVLSGEMKIGTGDKHTSTSLPFP